MSNNDFLGELSNLIDDKMVGGSASIEAESTYLSRQAPNVIEWVTGVDYWNVPSTFRFYRQYQILRDLFNTRCKICNSQDPEAVDCWGKPRSYLESEVLLVWDEVEQDMVCPKCNEKLIHPVDEQEYTKFINLKNKEFRVKMRMVGNSYTVSIPKEIVSFIREQEKIMNDMVKLCFEDAGKLSLNFDEIERRKNG